MKVIEINEGAKIPYEVTGKKVCFDDDLTINIAKRQEDWPVHIDVCTDKDGALVIGMGSGNYYVAQIDIPVREYAQPEDDEEQTEAEGESSKAQPEPIPLDMDDVTLTLWALENYSE